MKAIDTYTASGNVLLDLFVFPAAAGLMTGLDILEWLLLIVLED